MKPGLDFIKRHEGLRLEAYPDPASGGDPWTIGYGHTSGVKRGDTITQEQADAFLAADVAACQDAIGSLVTVPLTDGQRWALTSFVFNLGPRALRKSTLLLKLNAGDYAGAADEFNRWVNAAGKPMPGLVRRRSEERAMFLEESTAPTIAPRTAPQVTASSSEPVKEPFMLPLIPLLGAILPTLAQNIPALGKLFGSGSEVNERNVKAASLAIDIVQQAVGASNAQQAAEIVATDPAMAKIANDAVESQQTDIKAEFGPAEAHAAELAFLETKARPWDSTSFWAMIALVPLVYLVTLSLIGVMGSAEWAPEMRASIATMIVSLILGGVGGYYFGSATTRNKPQGAK